MAEEKFLKIVREMCDTNVLAHFDQLFCELYVRADDKRRKQLRKGLPETVEGITEYFKILQKEKPADNFRATMGKLNKEEIEDLKAVLREYLEIYKNQSVHPKAHKKEPCPKCELTKRLLRRLEK